MRPGRARSIWSGSRQLPRGGLPGEGPLQQIQEVSGPVAGAIALAAIAIAVGMLSFGGELNGFARRLVYVVLVAVILLGATRIVGLFGSNRCATKDEALDDVAIGS
ncbi:conjugal transfer TrbC/VIRB2 family protein (plasmid) [Rhizobium sp. CIAT894]|nr:conjugal transfer TrbC/VIRB2 family protein [Rhizobium sp. CIAT894]